ncbi:MAG: CHAT domain-containing tetratricopeptide repeat protein [Saprospiraceae bacterium]|nr:CHAT domain-containing tetratricopeptide repeat protein [Saprospiraceae bacterium]
MRTFLFVVTTSLSLFFHACNSSSQQPANQSIDYKLTIENKNADSIHNEGVNLDNEKKQYEAAIEKYKAALAIRRSLTRRIAVAEDSTRSNILKGIVKGLQNQSNCYYNLGNYEKAYQLQDNCIRFLDSLKQYPQVFDWEVERSITAYHRMGRIQNVRDNQEETLRNYRTSTTLCQNHQAKYSSRCRDMYTDYSELYVNWLEADSIIKYANMSINTGFVDSESYMPYINCGIGYGLKKDYQKALKYYDLAIANNPGEDLAKDHHNRAWLYLESSNHQKAQKHVVQAVAINSSHDNTSLIQKGNLGGNYSLKGDILREEKNYTDALKEYDKALSIFTNFPTRDLTPSNLKDIDTKSVYGKNRISILEALRGKSLTLFYQKKHETALSWYDAAIHLTNRFRQSLPDQSSKIKLAELTKKIFEGAIEACLALSKNKEAFVYAEQSKSYVLLESILQMKARGKLPDIDQSLQEKWKLAQQKIRFLNKQFAEATSSSDQIDVQKRIVSLQIELDRIDSVFNTNELFRKLTTFIPPDIPSLQQQTLQNNQALVEYFIGESQSYIFYLPPQGAIEIYPLAIGREALSQKVDSLVQIGIRLPYTMDSDIQNDSLKAWKHNLGGKLHQFCDTLYARYAHELYQLLLAPLHQSPQPKATRLMIIPDDVLGYLPFDALLTQKPNEIGAYRTYAYAGKKDQGFQLSYCYSAALLKEMQSHLRGSSEDILLAFCFNGELTFRDQIKSLQRLFTVPWDFFYRKFKRIDTKEDLMANIEKARFLHFATHGKMDDRNSNNSWLLMSEDAPTREEGLLYLYELYGLSLNADMVVTSACETGIGRLYRGEGIISLARGFSAAGASSIVTTLWSVDANKSGDLLQQFYQQLQSGNQKDGALSEAKQHWLQSRNSDWDAKPYFWAGIVPVGDMQAIQLPSKSNATASIIFYCIIGLAFAGLLFKIGRRFFV